jgi:predicted O-methyltransferase YrrM
MNLFQLLNHYIRYQIAARNPEKAGLPLPFDAFLLEPAAQTADPYLLKRYHEIRNERLKDHTLITITDLGAGDAEVTRRAVSSIARKSAQKEKYITLQYHLIRHLKPKVILEMGTSFGFTTAMFAMAAPEAQIITMEGCPNTAFYAEDLFNRLGLENITLIRGGFDQNLDQVFSNYGNMDYIFFDGNHRMIPTLNYFIKALSHRNDPAMFVFDDITWSDQMVEAWQEINKHPSIALSLDLFTIGILMFDAKLPKQRMKLKY